ncbi:MAG: hypothetical protein WCT18_02195 [Patescibacteria group bacterium]
MKVNFGNIVTKFYSFSEFTQICLRIFVNCLVVLLVILFAIRFSGFADLKYVVVFVGIAFFTAVFPTKNELLVRWSLIVVSVLIVFGVYFLLLSLNVKKELSDLFFFVSMAQMSGVTAAKLLYRLKKKKE